jgi:outer membrane protein assembly factor BamB
MKNLVRKNLSRGLVLCFLSAFSALSARNVCVAGDWAAWRGPEQNGVSRETNLPDNFSIKPDAAGNNLIWKADFGGRSTPIVMNGRVYLINDADEGTINEQERVMCFDANTGKTLHEYRFNIFFTDIVSVRVGWTNLVGDPETGNIYAHGVQGLLFCFDKDLNVVWSHSLTEEYGRISGYGGRVTSPVIDGDLMIIGILNSNWGEYARGGNRFLALDKKTGKVAWWADTNHQVKDSYYSYPVIANINGERLLISGGGDGGVHAFKVRTGEKVWSYIYGLGSVNIAPVVDGNLVYIGHGEENPDTNLQGRFICLDASQVTDGKPKLVWDRPGIKVKFCSPILHEGRLYICDEVAKMFCLDAKTGKTIWTKLYGRNAKGSPVWADGKIYVAAVNSQFCIMKPSEKTCDIIYKQYFPNHGGPDIEINGSPAIANGRIYFMTSQELYCIGKNNQQANGAPALPPLAEPSADSSAKPAHLQVFPSDVVLHPGEKVDFKARLYDDHGRFLREVKAEWKLASMLPPTVPIGAPPAPKAAPTPAGATPPVLQGDLSAEGEFAPAKTPPSQFGGIIASAEGLTGRVRVRVAPNLPYTPNFNNIPVGRTPGGWINCQGKFLIKEKDGVKVLAKLNTNANVLIARANSFMDLPNMHDYTIQADVLGTRKGGDMPDMGIIANRYTLMLDGNKQQLRLLSWEAVPRVDKSIAFPWKDNAWYRMKFTVEVQGDKATARGKVWPRDQAEPEDWTVTFEDPTPNKEGSPGVYAYSAGIEANKPGTEIYFDKVSVTPNKKQ